MGVYLGSNKVDGSLVINTNTVTALSLTITPAAWDNNTAIAVAAGVTTDNNIIIMPDVSSSEICADAGVQCISQAQDSLTFICEEVPSDIVTFNILIFN